MTEVLKSLPDNTYYRIKGKGMPVLLLHGFGEDGTIWEKQVAELSKSFMCIVPDLPGIGISASAFENLSDHSLEGLAEWVKKIADQEGISKFTLLGHSMGGYISMAFVEKHPEMLNGLGLIHSSALADNEEKISTRRRSIEFIRQNGAAKFIEQMIPGLYGEKFKAEHYEVVNQHIASALSFDAEVLIAFYEMMIKRPDRTKLLSQFQNPILFIMGTEDKAVNLSDGLAQSHLPVESHVEILEASGHMGMIENSEKTTIAMKKFLMHLNEN